MKLINVRTNTNLPLERAIPPHSIAKTDEISSNFANDSYWNILKIFIVVILCIVMSSPFTIIPQHDAIKNPKYWYETHIAVYFSFGLTRTIYDMMECKILFNVKSFM